EPGVAGGGRLAGAREGCSENSRADELRGRQGAELRPLSRLVLLEQPPAILARQPAECLFLLLVRDLAPSAHQCRGIAIVGQPEGAAQLVGNDVSPQVR